MQQLVEGQGTRGVRCGSCAAMFCLGRQAGEVLLEGCSCHHSSEAGSPSSQYSLGEELLVPVNVAVGRAADRSSCAEFLVLDHLCVQLGRLVDVHSSQARRSISGVVFVHSLVAPCVSGIGVAQQFRCLFPLVDVCLSFED
mmetsp:Transcript_24111/g.56136  ORF Transcript_24111/g.56136 Transcript_24111/m.56136 type:complete len:141 (+) Transcript_24111:630-1052(+)